MNRHAASLLCAAALAAASVRPAAAQGLLQQCDKAMADAEAMAQQIVSCSTTLAAAQADLKAKTASSSSAKVQAPVVLRTSTTVYVDVPAGTVPENILLAARAAPVGPLLMSYYSLSAFAAGDLTLCAPLGMMMLEKDCRREAVELMYQRAWQSSAAEFRAVCGKSKADFGEEFGADCCAIAVASWGRNPCAKLVPQCIPNLKSCGSFLAASAGPAGTCQQIQPKMNFGCDTAEECRLEREDCLGDAAFAAAFRAKDPSLCGGSARCRALMGEGKKVSQELATALLKFPAGGWFVNREWQRPGRRAADVIHAPVQKVRQAPAPGAPGTNPAATFKGFVCEEPLRSLANRKAASGVISAAHACLTGLEVMLPRATPTVAAELDAREEKLARLNLRMNAIFDGK